MKKTIGLSLVAGAFLAGSVQAAPMVIDDFNGTSVGVTAPVTSIGAGLSSAGFARSITATTSGNSTDVGLNYNVNPGVYAHSQNAGVTGRSDINYSLGGADLNNGANAFRIQLVSIDLNGFFGVVVNGVEVALSSTQVFLENVGVMPSYADILFSSFAGVNFDAVNTVSLFVNGNGTAALDATLDNFSTVCSAVTHSGGAGANPSSGNCTPPPPSVPVPGTIALFAAGMAAFGFGRRKAA